MHNHSWTPLSQTLEDAVSFINPFRHLSVVTYQDRKEYLIPNQTFIDFVYFSIFCSVCVMPEQKWTNLNELELEQSQMSEHHLLPPYSLFFSGSLVLFTFKKQ